MFWFAVSFAIQQAVAPNPHSVEIPRIEGEVVEIDGVLETNAEEFVRSFVQKGGQ